MSVSSTSNQGKATLAEMGVAGNKALWVDNSDGAFGEHIGEDRGEEARPLLILSSSMVCK